MTNAVVPFVGCTFVLSTPQRLTNTVVPFVGCTFVHYTLQRNDEYSGPFVGCTIVHNTPQRNDEYRGLFCWLYVCSQYTTTQCRIQWSLLLAVRLFTIHHNAMTNAVVPFVCRTFVHNTPQHNDEYSAPFCWLYVCSQYTTTQ